jgi:hypothetical protein
MIGFVSKYYRGLIEASLWVSLILCIAVVGWSMGGEIFAKAFEQRQPSFGHKMLGVIFIGLPSFAAVMAMTGAFINFLNMDRNIESMRESIDSIQETIKSGQAFGEKTQASNEKGVNPFA